MRAKEPEPDTMQFQIAPMIDTVSSPGGGPERISSMRGLIAAITCGGNFSIMCVKKSGCSWPWPMTPITAITNTRNGKIASRFKFFLIDLLAIFNPLGFHASQGPKMRRQVLDIFMRHQSFVTFTMEV